MDHTIMPMVIIIPMEKTEAIVLEIGKELGIKIIGSYKPEIFGCK